MCRFLFTFLFNEYYHFNSKYTRVFLFLKVYMGCWKDYYSISLDLPACPKIPLNSPDLCINQCSLLNYKYAGLQNGYVDRNDQNLFKNLYKY